MSVAIFFLSPTAAFALEKIKNDPKRTKKTNLKKKGKKNPPHPVGLVLVDAPVVRVRVHVGEGRPQLERAHGGEVAVLGQRDDGELEAEVVCF